MSVRLIVLTLMVAFLCVYAWRDWFKAMCGLIVLAGLLENPVMPKSILGIPGLNPWNLLMFSILASWLVQRRASAGRWDLPPHISLLLLCYLACILVGFVRAALDPSYLDMTIGTLAAEELVNTIKWVLPGLLLFDGARTRKRLVWAMIAIMVMYCVLALQLSRAVSWRAIVDAGVLERARLKLDRRVGLHAVDMSTMMAGAFWSLMAFWEMLKKHWQKGLIGLAALGCLYGQALTGGRAGFLAWAATGLVFCLIRWRKALLLAPLAPVLLLLVFPAAMERTLMGIGITDAGGQAAHNASQITSGRTDFWPYVVKQIGQRPVLGHGTQGTLRSGLTYFMVLNIEKGATWPHNAYLEWLMDHGIVGMVPVALFYLVILRHSGRLFKRARDPWFRAAGAACLAAVLVQLVSGIGSQHLYPRVGNMAMWCSIFLMLRVHVEVHRWAQHAQQMQLAAQRQWYQQQQVHRARLRATSAPVPALTAGMS